jgi:hypothetical protein
MLGAKGSEPEGLSGGPGHPVLEGATVASRGFKSNPSGVVVTFQIEELPDGSFAGIIFEPWNENNPALVGDGATRTEAQAKVVAHIESDTHGAPGG